MRFKSKIREDEHGIYVITNGERHRPGNINGYDHAYNMSNPGLQEGDLVYARHKAQSPLAYVTTQKGVTVVWACDYLHRKQR